VRDWLVAHGVTRVGMEATGVYWKPVFWVLEDAVKCWLLNARHMRNVPGRKTDMADAEWICRLMEHGLVRASFVEWDDLGADYYDRRQTPEHRANRKLAELRSLGWQVTTGKDGTTVLTPPVAA